MPTQLYGENIMASFVQNTNTSATAFTLAANEFGYVGESATLSLVAGTVVSMTGASSDLYVYGHLFSGSGVTVEGVAASSFHEILVGAGGSIVANSGRAISIDGGTITNYGTIHSGGTNAIVGTGGAIAIINYGEISRNTNSGFAIGYDGTGGWELENHGRITGNVGADSTATSFKLVNTGIIDGKVSDFSSSAAVVRNSGTITDIVEMRGGDDTYDGTGGRVYGAVRGEDGNDTLTGGDFAESLSGGNNDDVLRGNGGIDTLDGGANNDTLFFSIEDASVLGGTGNDTARNTYNDFGLTFDMGANSIEFYFGSQAGETIVTSANIRMDVDAGGGNDLIVGGAQGDGLSGGGGNDTIFGGLGPDQIGGGFGDDRIIAGAGADIVFGEQGNDTFVYNGVGDAGDTITDFEIGRDRIEILRSGFDFSLGIGTLAANRLVAGPANQAFGQFLLDTSTGNVWDGDGTGAGGAQFLFQTQGVGGLNNTDFVVV
jgi:serralysin